MFMSAFKMGFGGGGAGSQIILNSGYYLVSDNATQKIENFGFSEYITVVNFGSINPTSFPPSPATVIRICNIITLVKSSGGVSSQVFLNVQGSGITPPDGTWSNMHIRRPDNSVRTLPRANATTAAQSNFVRQWQWPNSYLASEQIFLASGEYGISFD